MTAASTLGCTDAVGDGTLMHRPRVLFLCQLPPPIHGAALINATIVESPVVHRAVEADVLPIKMGTEVRGVRRFSAQKLFASAVLALSLVKKLRGGQVDLVYLTVSVYGFAAVRDLALTAICRLFRVPHALHVHMQGLATRYVRSLLWRQLYKWTFAGAPVIHVSELLYADVSPAVERPLFHVVPNGVDDPFPDGPRAVRDGFGGNVLFLSNLLREKGPLDLMEASEMLANMNMEHKITFVGAEQDPEINQILRKWSLQRPGRVQICGQLVGAQKFAAYRDADIFVFPSWTECQPLVVLEAMAAGLPIVATRVGAIPEMLEDGAEALLFDPGDISGCAAAVSRLLGNSRLRHELGSAARQRYLTKYTKAHFEEAIATTLGKIAARHALGCQK